MAYRLSRILTLAFMAAGTSSLDFGLCSCNSSCILTHYREYHSSDYTRPGISMFVEFALNYTQSLSDLGDTIKEVDTTGSAIRVRIEIKNMKHVE
jgi:alanine racemase